MTNWKGFKIKYKSVAMQDKYVVLHLDDFIDYEDKRSEFIMFENRSPFNNYQGGDYLEVDIDRIKNWSYCSLFDTGIARKVSSEVVRGRSIAERLISEVNSQPPGKVEYEHVIEHRDRSPERFIYRRNH